MNEIFEYSIITYTQKEGEKGKKTNMEMSVN